MRTAMDKAHRAFVSLLGLTTVVSAVYFGMNAYQIVSHVNTNAASRKQEDGPEGGETAAK